MKSKKRKAGDVLNEAELAAFAKQLRIESGESKAGVARVMQCQAPSIFHSEESPDLPYSKMRRRLIEHFSEFEVEGPVYRLQKKKTR